MRRILVENTATLREGTGEGNGVVAAEEEREDVVWRRFTVAIPYARGKEDEALERSQKSPENAPYDTQKRPADMLSWRDANQSFLEMGLEYARRLDEVWECGKGGVERERD